MKNSRREDEEKSERRLKLIGEKIKNSWREDEE